MFSILWMRKLKKIKRLAQGTKANNGLVRTPSTQIFLLKAQWSFSILLWQPFNCPQTWRHETREWDTERKERWCINYPLLEVLSTARLSGTSALGEYYLISPKTGLYIYSLLLALDFIRGIVKEIHILKLLLELNFFL